MPRLLAFGFANPWLLCGLALGSLPVLIHLLHRRAFRETNWAAMRFLQEAARKNARRLRLEQIVLLTVRMLVLVLAVLAFAEPLVKAVAPQARARTPLHRVVVIDSSFSMGAESNGKTRFAKAQKTARQIVSDSLAGDAVNVFRIARKSLPAVVRDPAFERDAVLAEINRLALTDEPGDLRPTLVEVAEALADPRAPRTKEVVFLSDFQRLTWGSDALDRAELRQLFQRIADRARIVLLDAGDGRTENVAVTSLEAVDAVPLTNQPTRLRVGIRNFGETNLPSLRVELYVDGFLGPLKSVDLPPREETVLEFRHEFRRAGEHVVEVRTPADQLSADNQRWLSVPAVDRVNVLVVNGHSGSRAADNASHYVETVLAPTTSREQWNGATAPKVINEADLSAEDLSRYDCVFLCNVALVTPTEAGLLQAYAESGGGVVITLGDRVKSENYNSMLFRDGKGMLPARLGNRIGDARDPGHGGFTFDSRDLNHPVLDAFRGNPKSGLDRTVTLEYVQAIVSPNSPARIVLRYSSGDPAIAERPVGRGRCVLVTTSADVSWTTWPVHPIFPPLIHELVRFVGSGRWHDRRILVGEPLVRVLSSRESDGDLIVKRPDGTRQTVRPTAIDGKSELVYTETDRRGIYEVTLGSSAAGPQSPTNASAGSERSARAAGRTELFAVNVDTRESDLESIDDKSLRAGMLAGIPYEHRNYWSEAPRESGGGDTAWSGLSTALMAAVLGLLLVEPILAWRFWIGFILLGALITVGSAIALASGSLPVALIAAISLFAGFVVIARLANAPHGGTASGARFDSTAIRSRRRWSDLLRGMLGRRRTRKRIKDS